VSPSALIKKVRDLILNDSISQAIKILEGQLSDADTNEQVALIAHQLAKLYVEELADTSGKAADYALMAARSYLVDKRVAPAVGILKFLGNCPGGHLHLQKLQKWIEESTPVSKMRITSAPKARAPLALRAESFALFSDLVPEQIRKLLKLCSVKQLRPNTTLFSEGDAPTAFYVVMDGEMRLESSSGLRKTFTEGDFFGELALFGNMKRTATLKTTKGASLLVFSEKALKQAFSEWPAFPKKLFRFFNLRLFLNAAQRSTFFERFSEPQLTECFNFFKPVLFASGSTIMLQGDLSEALYLIVRGECQVVRDNKIVAILGTGQFVGEIGLLRSRPRGASVRASKGSILLKTDRPNFNRLVHEFPQLLKRLEAAAESRSHAQPEKFTTFRETLIVD
jgi:CRP-like cAMP-binding protein